MQFENLSDLRLISHAARTGSLSAAGRLLGMSPAAASAALKRLERQTGVRLFERSTRALRPTAECIGLIGYADRALDLLAEAGSQLTVGQGALLGRVRLAGPSDLTRSVLLPWLDEFLAAHPGVVLSLSVSDRLLDVVRDEVDVALRLGELADSRLVARRLAVGDRVTCASPAYLARRGTPRTPQDLLQHNCLTYHVARGPHDRWRYAPVDGGGAWQEVRVRGDRMADDAAIVHQWALGGAGVLCKSRLDVAQDIASGALVALLPGWKCEDYPLNAVLPSGRFVPARVRALVDFLATKFADASA
ncbi:LysR family transcriptional regulator [Xylophilus sp. GOD-11R]|uniref:LysR family transcriptional regulator n=1 Tax=Xylophilus sp. GOD-11R TaxID=3089814 RepID=UPI00298D079F|nr:LysR family transcriptional regulator [Xylophilus sp. GOD-11R]WPB57037.1 LysR family transcriptional regulator [Xylophilus sp. GOD-11R]